MQRKQSNLQAYFTLLLHLPKPHAALRKVFLRILLCPGQRQEINLLMRKKKSVPENPHSIPEKLNRNRI